MFEVDSKWEGWFKAPMPFGKADFKLTILEVKIMLSIIKDFIMCKYAIFAYFFW